MAYTLLIVYDIKLNNYYNNDICHIIYDSSISRI